MRRSGVVLALALVALLGVASAQEDCSAQVSAAVSPVQKQLDDVNSKYADLYALWQKQTSEIDTLKGSVGELKGKLEAVKAKPQAKLDLPTIALALVDLAKEGALAAWDEVKAIAEELKSGKTTKLEARVASTLSTFQGAASSVIAFMRREADEHLPEPVKKQIAAGAAKAQALWKEHVTDAAWAQPLLAQLKSVNEEVTKVVSSALTSTPALAPLSDPVTVQLVVYAVFALPVLVLVLLVLVLVSGGKKKDAAAEGGKPGGSKKKGKGPKRA